MSVAIIAADAFYMASYRLRRLLQIIVIFLRTIFDSTNILICPIIDQVCANLPNVEIRSKKD